MKEEKSTGKKKIVIVRIRGIQNIRKDIKDTMDMLRLYRKNFCVIVPETDCFKGMIAKVKDFVTWGEINEETLKLLKEKRGKEGKKFFRLSPPRKGYGRKGIKIPFKVGGGLGYRAEKINDLIKRMI